MALSDEQRCPLLDPKPSKQTNPALPPRAAIETFAAEKKKFSSSITEQTTKQLDGTIYSVVTHAESGFDKDQTRDGVGRLVTSSRLNGIPSIGIVLSQYNSQHFSAEEIDEIVDSPNGDHRLHFPNATDFIIGGGNLSFCLCETVRDLIRNTNQTRPLRFVLVADAIYDLYGSPATVDRDKPFLLASCTEKATAEVYKHLVEVFSAHGKVCGDYVSYTATELKNKNLKFHFSIDGKSVGPDVGIGSRIVNVEVVSSAKLNSILQTEKALRLEHTKQSKISR